MSAFRRPKQPFRMIALCIAGLVVFSAVGQCRAQTMEEKARPGQETSGKVTAGEQQRPKDEATRTELVQKLTRFNENGDGTVTDKLTGLMWVKKDSGAELGKGLDWHQSARYVAELRTGGYNDWRMPTIAELKTLYDEAFSTPSFRRLPDFKQSELHYPPAFAPGGAVSVWSSERDDRSNFARFFIFSTGRDLGYYCGHDQGVGVRAVRNAKR